MLLILLVGKSLTTSVPSMAIRFNATAEEIEEVFTKEEDRLDDAVTESIGTVLPTGTYLTKVHLKCRNGKQIELDI